MAKHRLVGLFVAGLVAPSAFAESKRTDVQAVNSPWHQADGSGPYRKSQELVRHVRNQARIAAQGVSASSASVDVGELAVIADNGRIRYLRIRPIPLISPSLRACASSPESMHSACPPPRVASILVSAETSAWETMMPLLSRPPTPGPSTAAQAFPSWERATPRTRSSWAPTATSPSASRRPRRPTGTPGGSSAGLRGSLLSSPTSIRAAPAQSTPTCAPTASSSPGAVCPNSG